MNLEEVQNASSYPLIFLELISLKNEVNTILMIVSHNA